MSELAGADPGEAHVAVLRAWERLVPQLGEPARLPQGVDTTLVFREAQHLPGVGPYIGALVANGTTMFLCFCLRSRLPREREVACFDVRMSYRMSSISIHS